MVAIGDLLQPSQSRMPQSTQAAEPIYVHLADPIRRALLRAIGFETVAEGYLRASYGISWGSVQPALRALVRAGLIEISGTGAQTVYRLDLSQFPRSMSANLFGDLERRAAA